MSIVNLNNTTPAAPGGNTNVTWQQSGDSVSAYVPNSTSPLTTKGDLYGYDTGPDRVPIGSDGQILTADSGQSLGLKWAAPAGGGAMVLLATSTASSSAALDFTSLISSTYYQYVIELVDLAPATSGQRLLLQMSTDNGSTYDTGSNYQWATHYSLGFAAAGGDQNNSADSGIQIGPGNLDASTTWGGISGQIVLRGPASSGYKQVTGASVAKDGGDAGLNNRVYGGMYLSGTAVTAFRLIMTGSVNLASGTVIVYGLTH